MKKNISICVGIKNRSHQLLNYLLTSLQKIDSKELIDLSIYDCGSDDVPHLEVEIKKLWGGSLTYIVNDIKFSRTLSFNRAVKQSPSNFIFLCDADMTLPIDFINQYWANVSTEACWFPICFSLYKDKLSEIKKENGWWRTTGTGMVGISKDNFLSIGGLDEKYKTWGGEDDDLFNRCKLKNFKINRANCLGLFHNWHAYKSDDINNRW